jgi:hypothetical protein
VLRGAGSDVKQVIPAPKQNPMDITRDDKTELGGQPDAPTALPQCIHRMGGWVGPRAGQDTVVAKRKISTPPANRTAIF